MEYYRDRKNQIRADFSLRIGKLVSQYENSGFQEDVKFEVTLFVIALQSLLTQCQELYRAMNGADRKKEFLASSVTETSGCWGINKGLIKEDTFGEEPLTLDKMICHIRNSLSHPTALELESSFPSTGYTTIPDNSGIIKSICFIDSPDTKKNRIIRFRSETHHKIIELKKLDGVSIKKIKENVEIYYQPEKDGKPFARIFRVEIPVPIMRDLVLGLSNYLAQPCQKNWDGETIVDLIRAA